MVVKSKLSLRDDALRLHQEQQQEQPQHQQWQHQQQQHHQQQHGSGLGLRSHLLAMRGWSLPSASASASASASPPDASASDTSSRASADTLTQARGRPPGGYEQQHPHPSCAGGSLAELLDMPSCTPFALFGGPAQVKAAV